MSYDLHIYSVNPFDPAMFAGAKDWNPDHSSFQTKNWQIVVNSSDKILPEDVEDEIASLLPGIEFLTELNLEGVQTDQSARRLKSVAKAIAKASHGVIEDPQEDTIETPSGVSRFAKPPKEESFSIFEMSWWFLDNSLLDHGKRDAFFDLLERRLPEAMPKRYGLYEPPQHVYAETGKQHFRDFFHENLHDMNVWQTSRPVTGVYLRFPKPMGPWPQGFRFNSLEIGVEIAALAQPGWAQSMHRFWREMSSLVRPIYGEVRKQHGYIRRGGTIYHAFNGIEDPSEKFLTRAWFFRGIPPQLGSAVVLGEQYQRLWPQFVAKADVLDDLAFASLKDWSSDEDLSDFVGAPPKDQVLHPVAGIGKTQAYPKGWPFGPVFAQPKL